MPASRGPHFPSLGDECKELRRWSLLGDSCGFYLILQCGARRLLDTHTPILQIFLRCLRGSYTLKPSFVGT